MKRTTLLLTALLLVPLPSLADAWLKLDIATAEYPPYTSEDMKHEGYINHIIEEAFLEVGVVVTYTSMPWEEAKEATLAGKYDAMSYANYVREREKDFWHSDPMSAESLVLYASKKSGLTQWNSLSDLDNYKMGMTEGYLFTDELATYLRDADNVEKRDSDYANLQALINGDIDVFAIDELSGWYWLQREFDKNERAQVVELTPSIETMTSHLIIPKNSKDGRLILELFNKGLEDLKLDGKLKRYKKLLKDGFYQHPDKPVNFDRR